MLRYPGGLERRIRYPESAEQPEAWQLADYADVDDDGESWGVCRDNDPLCPSFGSDDAASTAQGSASSVHQSPQNTRSWLEAAIRSTRDVRNAVHTSDQASDQAPPPHGNAVEGSTSDASQTAPSSGAGNNSSSASSAGSSQGGASDAPHANLDSAAGAAAAPRTPAPLSALPSSPAALLAYLQSPEYGAQQRAAAARVRAAFRIATGCPWVVPKPAFVVAVARGSAATPRTYTLPTAVEQDGTASEIAAVCGCPGLGDALRVDAVKDGVVCFECEASAALFARSLQDDGLLTASLVSVDSHELFRSALDASGVVVLMARGKWQPRACDLAAALRRKQSMDDFM